MKLNFKFIMLIIVLILSLSLVYAVEISEGHGENINEANVPQTDEYGMLFVPKKIINVIAIEFLATSQPTTCWLKDSDESDIEMVGNVNNFCNFTSDFEFQIGVDYYVSFSDNGSSYNLDYETIDVNYPYSLTNYIFPCMVEDCDNDCSNMTTSINSWINLVTEEVVESGTTPELTLQTSLTEDVYTDDFTFHFNASDLINITNDSWDCNLYLNGTLNTTKTGLVLNLTNQNFSLVYGHEQAGYNINVTCNTTEQSAYVYDDFVVNDVFIDSIIPNMSINSTLINNSKNYIPVDRLDYSFTCQDTNLYDFNRTRLLNGAVNDYHYVSNIVDTSYTYHVNNITGDVGIGNVTEIISCKDSHTGDKLKYVPYKDEYENAYYNGMKFYCSDVKKIEIKEDYDKVKFKVKFNTEAYEHNCYYTNGIFEKVLKDNYPNHYVDTIKNIWIDDFDAELIQISPTTLNLKIVKDELFDEYETKSTGDLNNVTQVWEYEIIDTISVLSSEFNISATNFSSDSYVLIEKIGFNTTASLTALILVSMNIEKISHPSEVEVWGEVRVDGTAIHEELLRTVTGTGSVGSTGFKPFINSFTTGQHNISLYMKRTIGSGTIQVKNIDFNLHQLYTNKDTVGIANNTNTVFSFTNNDFEENYNFTFTPLVSGDIYHICDIKVNASGTAKTDFRLSSLDETVYSPIASRYLADSDDLGSVSLSYTHIEDSIQHNMSFMSRTDAETVTVNLTVFNGNFLDNETNKIQHDFESNENTNLSEFRTLTAGTHLIQDINFTNYNGTHVFINAWISVNSSSGLQTPTFYINTTDEVCSIKERTLSSNDDIGNIFMYASCGDFVTGEDAKIDFYVDVESGETLNILDEGIGYFETVEFNIQNYNILPILTMITDLPNTNLDNTDLVTILNVFDSDSTNLNVTINWYRNASLIKTETTETSSLENVTFTLDSGFYSADDIINASIYAYDGIDNSITVNSNDCTILSSSETEQIVEAINDLNDSLTNTTNLLQEGVNMIAWILLFIVTWGLFFWTNSRNINHFCFISFSVLLVVFATSILNSYMVWFNFFGVALTLNKYKKIKE